MIAGLASLDSVSTANTFKQLHVELDRSVGGGDWVLSVARNYVPGRRAWMLRPRSCWRLAKIRQQLGQIEGEARLDIDVVARTLAMVEFGVDVDAAQYRQLRIHAIERWRGNPQNAFATSFLTRMYLAGVGRLRYSYTQCVRALIGFERIFGSAFGGIRPPPGLLLNAMLAVGMVIAVMGFLAAPFGTSVVYAELK